MASTVNLLVGLIAVVRVFNIVAFTVLAASAWLNQRHSRHSWCLQLLKKQESHLILIVLKRDSVHQAPVSMKKWNKKTQDGNWLATQQSRGVAGMSKPYNDLDYVKSAIRSALPPGWNPTGLAERVKIKVLIGKNWWQLPKVHAECVFGQLMSKNTTRANYAWCWGDTRSGSWRPFGPDMTTNINRYEIDVVQLVQFVAIFADVVRKVRILTTTKHMWEGDSVKWRGDIKTICNATVSQFESLSSIMCKHGKESTADMMRLAAEHKLLPLSNALQYMTFQIANIPLTQGYKMSLRHLGFAMNIYDGPLSIFLTTNFADLYSSITVTLMNGAGEPLGKREINLLDDAPDMPTLQAMHPMIQVELFLLMDRLVHTELVCMNAFLGEQPYFCLDNECCRAPPQEDDSASTLQIGIAEFPRSALKPLEAQGRGFAHGHEKIISVPRMRAAKLKQLFMENKTAKQPGDDLDKWCMKAREAVLQAASTLQYDSAVYAGSQLGVQLRPEPFSDRQQRQSKLDGQVEEADDDKPARAKMETTLEELNGHLKKEAEACVAHGRPTLHSFKQLPLTGAIQSMMPNFRRSDSFGCIHEPDEYGYYQGHRERKQPPHVGLQNCYEEYEMTMDGEITNFCMPDGSVATAADVAADRQAWETSFARDQRANFIQNHDHDCTETCVKYRKKKQSGTDVPQRAGRKLTDPGVSQCRFRFFRHVPLMLIG